MSIWSRISQAISALTQGQSLAEVLDLLRAPREHSVAFTIAVIAISAKMAKADGQVTRDEVTAFREVFHIAAEDEAHAAKVFNLARQDVAGFEDYAHRIFRMFGQGSQTLADLMEGLFHIAAADGLYHPNEDAFLKRVAEIFQITDRQFASMKMRYVPKGECCNYQILGVTPDTPFEDIRAAYRRLVRESHPDVMIARGVPEEAVGLAQKKLADINAAWDDIAALHQPA